MAEDVARREFLKTVSVAAGALAATQCAGPADTAPAAAPGQGPATSAPPPPSQPAVPASTRLEPFDFSGVRLLPSRWQQQVAAARDYYLADRANTGLHIVRLTGEAAKIVGGN